MKPLRSRFSPSECAEGCDIRPNQEPVHISLPMRDALRKCLRGGSTHEWSGPPWEETSVPLLMPTKENNPHPAATLPCHAY